MRFNLSLAPAILLFLCGASLAKDGDERPNIIVIVADDMGFGDVGFNGCEDIPTPNIDSLAQNGVRFANGYVSCPVCSPTRAGMLTGRYQQRFGHEFNPRPPARTEEQFGLPLSQVMLPQMLRSAGYRTGIVGKWHLGYKPQFHPLERGFESFFGFPGGSHSYIDAKADPRNLIYRDREVVDEKEYLTEAFAREAGSYIDTRAPGPFFLYLAFNAVHTPLQAPQKYLDRFTQISDTRRRTYAAMQSAMDDAIGKVVQKLRETNALENTLIFFFSDNGGPSPSNGSRNGPLRGVKTETWEGGIHVPFVMHWPAGLPRGKTYNQPVISLDVVPTCLSVAGAKAPAGVSLDGVNLLPYITGKAEGRPHDALFWRYGGRTAVRMGDWKLVVMPPAAPQLFNLARDLSEKQDLAAQEPDKMKELAAAWAKWSSELAKPLWGPDGASAPRPNAAQSRPRR